MTRHQTVAHSGVRSRGPEVVRPSGGLGAGPADAFARGVVLYGEGRYDESALVVVPRIEGVIRELARRAGFDGGERRRRRAGPQRARPAAGGCIDL